jgi:glycosyltransferase involved in cell wall biosynthesis
MKVSTLILTFNEEANLPACLDALAWCDDILVLDSGSTDATVSLARERGARILTRPFDTFAAQRNFGVEQGALRHDWVLHLDADEIVTPKFAQALVSLAPPVGIDAWRVPSKTILFGRWLRHAGMWPTHQVRLGHLRRLRFVQVGHGQREALPPDRVGTFPEPYLHYSFSHGMRRWLEKHVVYARAEAEELIAQRQKRGQFFQALTAREPTERRRAAKNLASHLPLVLRPLARFFYIYLVRSGFRDGRSGLVYAVMLSVYEGMIALFAMERSLSDSA